jgi:pyroglutamyl-peptidase
LYNQRYPKNPGRDEDGHYEEDDNNSHLLTTLLPSSLPPFSKHNPTPSTIRILNPTSAPGPAVKSEYAFVRSYCRDLWEEHGNDMDLILHLGMADGWESVVLIEKSAWKEGAVKSVDTGSGNSPMVGYYIMPDDIG